MSFWLPIRLYAAIGSIILLGQCLFELFATGNLRITGGPPHDMNALSAMTMTIWLCCTLACAIQSLIAERERPF